MKPDIRPPFSPQQLANRRRAKIDGFTPALKKPQLVVRPTVQRAKVQSEDTSEMPRALAKPVKNSPRWVGIAQSATVITVALIVGLFVQTLPLGEVGILAFGVIALLRRIASKKVFIVCLVLLALMGICMAIGQSFLAERMAVFTFLMFIIALLCTLREIKFVQKVAKSAVNNTQA